MVGLINAIFPPQPTLTEKNLPSQAAKVFIITGAASGVGFELAKILYGKDATVYIAARSEKRATDAISKIEAAVSASKGKLLSMAIDLADLTTIKLAVEAFLKQESRLDVLVHNAGVMVNGEGSKTRLGHDLEMGTHCLGPFLLTKLLQDTMIRTAASEPSKPYSVRVVWVTSLLQLGAPSGGVQFDEKGTPKVLKAMANYMESKVGMAWLAYEFSKQLDKDRIMSVSVHPGLMRTELQRTMPAPGRALMSILLKPAIYGAYSELFAAFSQQVMAEHNGGYIMAWGRLAEMPDDVAKGVKSKQHGGTGGAEKFWIYCERETKYYL